MYASFAKNSPAPVGADLLSLSWKGDARRGWLVSGNSRKTVGVTYTQLTDDDEFECDLFESTAEQSEISLERQANRRNFNFREHAHEVPVVMCAGDAQRSPVEFVIALKMRFAVRARAEQRNNSARIGCADSQVDRIHLGNRRLLAPMNFVS